MWKVDLERLLIWYKAMEGPSSVLRRRKEADGEEEDRLGHGVGMINARRGGLRNGRGNAGGDDDSGESDLDM